MSKDGCALPGLVQYQEQVASLVGHFAADFMLYPVETVIHRLHLQVSPFSEQQIDVQ